ncbi:MAG TPA: MaoC family dehydratase [Stellaceae bacterium]|jgi:acyl dehydratase|nr:MaoC family dehydratase [Stellaceae bacterium]
MTEPVRDKQIHEKPGRYFEDYPVGAVYVGGPITVSEEDILEFARRYDPQPMHIDKAAAEAGQFGGLIASGWHTGSLVMQLMVKHFVPTPGNLASPGLDELRWLRPVRPGDSLSLRVTIESARLSRSKPGQGVVTGLVEALNQRGETVMSLKPISLMRCRPAS